MATKQVKSGTIAQATSTRKAAAQTAMQAAAAALAAAPAAPAATSVQPPQGTPLPANWVATAPSAQASAQVFAAYRLPNSLQAKGANLCGGELGKLQSAKLLPGKPYVARSGHNAARAAKCTELALAAAATGGVPATDLLKAGVGAHSVKAYVKRGWLKVA
jgi:hypothetical protein